MQGGGYLLVLSCLQPKIILVPKWHILIPFSVEMSDKNRKLRGYL